MKNTLLTIATALVLIFTSCKKTEVPTHNQPNKINYTVEFKTDKNPSVKALINGQPKALYTQYVVNKGDVVTLTNTGIDSVINQVTAVTGGYWATHIAINSLDSTYQYYVKPQSVIIRPSSTVNTQVNASIVVNGITVTSFNGRGDAYLTYTIE